MIPIGSTSFPFRRFIGFARAMGPALDERSSDRTGASAPPLFNNQIGMWKTQCINAMN